MRFFSDWRGIFIVIIDFATAWSRGGLLVDILLSQKTSSHKNGSKLARPVYEGLAFFIVRKSCTDTWLLRRKRSGYVRLTKTSRWPLHCSSRTPGYPKGTRTVKATSLTQLTLLNKHTERRANNVGFRITKIIEILIRYQWNYKSECWIISIDLDLRILMKFHIEGPLLSAFPRK